MATKITLGEPEWIGVKSVATKFDPTGMWQLRRIVSYRPNVFMRLLGYKPSEDVHTYSAVCIKRTDPWSWSWTDAEGRKLSEFNYNTPEYALGEELNDHVKDFILRDERLKQQERIIMEARA